MYVRCCLLLVKILGVTCARYESRSKMCNVYYMFYVTSSATGDRLSYVCRGNDLTHFTRQLLDHRTTELVSQMRQTDEVYSVKQRRRRSSQSYSLAAEPLETIDPTLFGAPHNEQLRDYDGSGELTDNDRMPPAEEISEGVVDGSTLLSAAGSDDTGTMSQPHHTEMMPYGKVVHPRHSTTLRTFCLKYCHPSSHYYIRSYVLLFAVFTNQFLCLSHLRSCAPRQRQCLGFGTGFLPIFFWKCFCSKRNMSIMQEMQVAQYQVSGRTLLQTYYSQEAWEISLLKKCLFLLQVCS